MSIRFYCHVISCALARRGVRRGAAEAVQRQPLSPLESMRVSVLKLAFHDADTDTDFFATILARMSARMSVSVSWNAALTRSV